MSGEGFDADARRMGKDAERLLCSFVLVGSIGKPEGKVPVQYGGAGCGRRGLGQLIGQRPPPLPEGIEWNGPVGKLAQGPAEQPLQVSRSR